MKIMQIRVFFRILVLKMSWIRSSQAASLALYNFAFHRDTNGVGQIGYT